MKIQDLNFQNNGFGKRAALNIGPNILSILTQDGISFEIAVLDSKNGTWMTKSFFPFGPEDVIKDLNANEVNRAIDTLLTQAVHTMVAAQ